MTTDLQDTDPPCSRHDPDLWFSESSGTTNDQTRTALALCAVCPIRAACLAYALRRQEQFGVWGGLTTSQRNKLLGKRLRPVTAYREGKDAQVRSAARLRQQGNTTAEIGVRIGVSERTVRGYLALSREAS